jgi:hypothetical protein
MSSKRTISGSERLPTGVDVVVVGRINEFRLGLVVGALRIATRGRAEGQQHHSRRRDAQTVHHLQLHMDTNKHTSLSIQYNHTTKLMNKSQILSDNMIHQIKIHGNHGNMPAMGMIKS